MQGLVNFATDLGYGLSGLLPALCYLSAIGCFFFAGWGFWCMAEPGNQFRQRPWIPPVSLMLCGAFATFDKLLNEANVSAGTGMTVTFSAGQLGTPPSVGNVVGNSPSDAIVNVVTLFQGFFQPFGALCAFFAVVAWRQSINGRSNRGWGSCSVQFVFGVMLINIVTLTTKLAAYFQSS